jgi:hypothetical protein
MRARPTMIDYMAGELWSDEVASGPYSAACAAAWSLDAMRRHRVRALWALFAPEWLVTKWGDDACDAALEEESA